LRLDLRGSARRPGRRRRERQALGRTRHRAADQRRSAGYAGNGAASVVGNSAWIATEDIPDTPRTVLANWGTRISKVTRNGVLLLVIARAATGGPRAVRPA